MLTTSQKTAIVCAALTFGLAIYSFLKLDTWIALIFFVLHSIFMILLVLFSIKIPKDDAAERITNIKTEWRSESERLKAEVAEKDSIISSLREQENALREANYQLGEEVKRLEEEASKRSGEMIHSRELEYISILPKLPSADEDTAPVNLLTIAKSVIRELSKDAAKVGLSVTVSSSEKTVPVKADRDLIRILFRNIIDNSIKYMNRQGSLIITISAIGDDVFIIFKDTGEGLTSTETEHVFELNFQGSNRISGNGLGLYQAKAIVNYYGGTIYAKSHVGGGMGIYIQLSLATD
ncbi:MAG: HAMP domain-containing histidine kinase [Lachnospiraceae bacterium]|nr:HAMP domain-containing histidine kinase [Lachnospiraceae bacterium]